MRHGGRRSATETSAARISCRTRTCCGSGTWRSSCCASGWHRAGRDYALSVHRDHGHDHRLIADRRALTIALVLVATILVGEIVAGLASLSLALLAAAGHLLTDAAALALALVPAGMGARPAAGPWPFGYSRLEILAAQANGITLGLLAVWIVWSAIHRLVDPRDVRGGVVLFVALAGALASVLAAYVLARASKESLNVPG